MLLVTVLIMPSFCLLRFCSKTLLPDIDDVKDSINALKVVGFGLFHSVFGLFHSVFGLFSWCLVSAYGMMDAKNKHTQRVVLLCNKYNVTLSTTLKLLSKATDTYVS